MLSSSRNVAFGSAAWTSLIVAKVSAVSDSVPKPPARVRLQMLPTGVSIRSEPFLAIRPAMKAKLPLVTASNAECEAPSGSQMNSSNTTRVPCDSTNSVPSIKRIPIVASYAVSISSPWWTGSPTMISTAVPPARLNVPEPIAVSMVPMIWGSTAKTASSPDSMWDATNIGFDLACPAWCRRLFALACQRQESEISDAGSLGCPPKRLIEITQSLQGERRAQGDVKQLLVSPRTRPALQELLNLTWNPACALLMAPRKPRD